MMDDPQYLIWREKIAPLIYDWFAHHNLPWPTQACRFGSVVEDMTYKTRYRVYYSEQTDDSEPQKLIVSTADVCKPGIASAEVVSSWTDFSKSPYLKEQKVIFHPGEVNKIRELPLYPNLVVTHTDAPEVYVWNVDKQPNRSRTQMRGKGGADSIPDLLLTGHKDEALFPLATTPSGPAVASGGNDCMVLVWSLDDNITTLQSGGSGGSAGARQAPTLACRSKLEGHSKAVEEVVFKPNSTQELASVGDDCQLLFWDCRTGGAPVMSVTDAHGPSQDVQCVDWSGLADHCVATGAQDGSVKVWDVRALKGPDDTLATLRCHTDAIIRLEWHPHCKGVLASGGDDKVVMLWRIDPDAAPGVGPAPAARSRKALAADKNRPKELIMQHSGHRRGKVVDFQWCPTVNWAIMSVSDDSADEDVGGGSLQMWRPSELLYGDEQQLLESLEKHREWILNGRNPPAPPPPLLVEKSKEEVEAAAAAAAKAARDAAKQASRAAAKAAAEVFAEPKSTRAAAKRAQSEAAPDDAPAGSAPPTPAEGGKKGRGKGEGKGSDSGEGKKAGRGKASKEGSPSTEQQEEEEEEGKDMDVDDASAGKEETAPEPSESGKEGGEEDAMQTDA